MRQNICSLAQKVISLAQKVIPLAQKVIPLAQKVIPLAQKVIPLAQKVIPLAQKVYYLAKNNLRNIIQLISLLIYLTDICIELTSMEEFVFGLGKSFIELMNYLVYY